MDDLAHELAVAGPNGARGERRRPPRRAGLAIARPRRLQRLPLPWIAAALLPLAGCGPAEAARDPGRDAIASPDAPPAGGGPRYEIPALPPDRLRLSGAASSLDDLLRTVETSLAEGDTTRLLELMVTAGEYERILYPAFPAAHPPINAGFETLWLLHVTDAIPGLRKVLRDYGGRRVRILHVRFEKPDQDFVNFILDETSAVDLEVDGERRDGVRLFGSVFHVGNQWKVLSYPDD
jgi:hypothetical protein